MTDKEIIECLKTLISESYAGNPIVARHFTIVRDCKKDSFDFVINEAINTIKAKEKQIEAMDDYTRFCTKCGWNDPDYACTVNPYERIYQCDMYRYHHPEEVKEFEKACEEWASLERNKREVKE